MAYKYLDVTKTTLYVTARLW